MTGVEKEAKAARHPKVARLTMARKRSLETEDEAPSRRERRGWIPSFHEMLVRSTMPPPAILNIFSKQAKGEAA